MTVPSISGLPRCFLQRALGTRCGGQLQVPGPTPTPPAVPCCAMPVCGRLRVIVYLPKPWSIVPGYIGLVPTLCPQPPVGSSCDPADDPPAACQPLRTAGVPWPVKLAARNGRVAFSTSADLPDAVIEQYPDAAAQTQFLFDFAGKGVTTGEGSGAVFAYGQNGCVQAELDFVYRWCGPLTCADVTVPNFELTKATYKNAKFFQLSSFISTDTCVESVVVVMLQQYCCCDDPPAVPCADCPGDVLSPDQTVQACAGTISCLDQTRIGLVGGCPVGCGGVQRPENQRVQRPCPPCTS